MGNQLILLSTCYMLERSCFPVPDSGMAKAPKRPRDANALAKFITDIATGQVELPKTDDGKDPAAVALGRKGGLKGGKVRAGVLSPRRRKEIAQKAARARWKVNPSDA